MNIKILLIFLCFILTASYSYAYNLRNTYTATLICTQMTHPHTIYYIPSHSSQRLKVAGKYQCESKDGLYTSVCSVSEIQPTATFNTDDGSASCSTPVLMNQKK